MRGGEDAVAGIIVCFNPDPQGLAQLMARIAGQVEHLVLVDNASSHPLRQAVAEQAAVYGALLLENQENLGLATGQRLGIEIALTRGAAFSLLLDQDSLPEPDMVERLLAAYRRLTCNGARIAGVGPRAVLDSRGLGIPFIRFKPYAALKGRCRDEGDLVRSDFLISSGLLTPAWVYASVGLPDDALFIDNVDMEWCFRARHLGFLLYGVCDAVLHHRIGRQMRFFKLLPNSGPIYIHEPVRQYYQTRNRILLYGRRYTPWAWTLQDIPRALFKLCYFGLMIPPRRQNLRMMWLGLRDALRGIGGPFRHGE